MKKYIAAILGICILVIFASCADTSEETTALTEETTVSVETTLAEETVEEETTVSNTEIKEETVQEVINFDTQKQYSDTLEEGKVTTKVRGVNGVKEIIYRVTYVDGEETEREVISENTVKEPVAQILVYGTKKVVEETTEAQTSAEETTQAVSKRPPADLSKYAEGTVVSVQAVDDCDGSGHGYYTITLSDGTVEYQEY